MAIESYKITPAQSFLYLVFLIHFKTNQFLLPVSIFQPDWIRNRTFLDGSDNSLEILEPLIQPIEREGKQE